MKPSSDRAHQITPCENCPYRIDAPRGYWHPEEFESVLAAEEREFGGIFACHKHKILPEEKRGLCAGWLLDQKRRNLPSIMLRIKLGSDPSMLDAFEKVSDGGHAMFDSIESMCIANGVRPKR